MRLCKERREIVTWRQWSQQHSFNVGGQSASVSALSWGASEELLIGSSDLRLYETQGEETLIWSRQLSSPVEVALFSPDASLIASTARYDRLVKLWRRLSYGSDDVRFGSSYLAHPSTVTGIHWRALHSSEHNKENILYTTCVDNKVRIWTPTDPHSSQMLQLWAEINIQESIQPRHLNPTIKVNERYVFFIGSQEFKTAINAALETAGSQARQQKYVLEHLAEVSQRSPEVCVVLDNRGHMSAWGIENIGGKNRTPTDVFNFAHVENCNILLPQKMALTNDCIRFLSFCTDTHDMKFAVLVHYFDGKIVWKEGAIEEFFDPSPGKARLETKALWTGHEGSVKKIVRTVSGQALISRTNDNEGLIWKQRHGKDGMALARQSLLNSPEHIHRTWLMDDGQFTANLHHKSISLWDSRKFEAKQVARCEYQIEGKPLCLLQLPSPASNSPFRYLATISSRMRGIVWEIQLPQESGHDKEVAETKKPTMKRYCEFDLGLSSDLAFVVPIDPAGSAPILSGFLDTFAKDIALSYTNAGIVHTWTAKVDVEAGSVDWLLTSTVETGVDRPFLANGSSIRKIALVNASRNGLSIWDSRSGQLEFGKEYSAQELIQDLDWTSTPDEQSILAVGFPHKVIILAQVRYDYLNKGPAWAPIREIYIREPTPHPIGDSTWLGSGNLVIGAGTQLFVYDKLITASDEMITDLSIASHGHQFIDLFDVVSALNGPLPLYHPQFLAQCILAGKLALVSRIIVSLNKVLKFSDGEHVESLLNMPLEDFVADEQVRIVASILTCKLTGPGCLNFRS